MAISQINLCVVFIKQRMFEKAQKAAKSAVALLEPIVFKIIKSEGELSKSEREEFQELLEALLVGYSNLGMASFKLDN